MEDLNKLKVTGSKNGSGMAEFIINHVPDCSLFVEAFGGRASVSRTLEKCVHSINRFIVFELNLETLMKLRDEIADSSIETFGGDSIDATHQSLNRSDYIWRSTTYFFDPPYRMESRSHKRKYYGKTDWDDEEHQRFFRLVDRLNQNGFYLLISHYPDPVYDEKFKDWNREDFQTRTRKSTVTERLYWNFDLNEHWLATTDYLGKNYTYRQRIKRKVERMQSKINALPRHERQAIITRIQP